jgi:hypothetical protein
VKGLGIRASICVAAAIASCLTVTTFGPAVADATCGSGPTWGPIAPDLPDGAPCSLRDILQHKAANGDQVVLTADATYTVNDAGESLCADGGIDVDTSVHIIGNGAKLVVDCTGGNANALNVLAPDVALDHVTITTTAGKGGGGGIFYWSHGLEITDSTIADNVNCASPGGGITLKEYGARIVNTTITGNWSPMGGGLAPLAYTETDLTNSTVTGNNSSLFGGGIATAGYMTIIDSDVVGNANGVAAPELCAEIPFADDAGLQQLADPPESEAGNAANIFLGNIAGAPGPLNVLASVIAEPVDGVNCLFFGRAQPSANLGHNFSDDDTCMLEGPGDRQNAGDPELGELGDNGGFTPTMMTLVGSPLLDTVPLDVCETLVAFGITTDQRGISRPQGAGCDVGSVEIERPGPSAPASPPVVLLQPRFTG